MERKCRNCRWWRRESIDQGHVCVNARSDDVTEFTDSEHSCGHWGAEIEQDGWSTWEVKGA